MPRSDTQFKKGQSGNMAGKKPGTKNKINGKVWEICEKWNCNPVEVLCWIATDNLFEKDKKVKLTPRLMLEAAAELAQYCYPKLKSIDFAGNEKNPVNFYFNLSEEALTKAKSQQTPAELNNL